MILQFAPLIDQISVPVQMLGGFVVPVVDVECLNGKGRAKSIPKAYWGVGKQCTTDSTQDVWKIYITLLLTTLCKIMRPVRLRLRWELVNRLPKIQTEAEFSTLMSEAL